MLSPLSSFTAGEAKLWLGSLWRALAVMLRWISRRPTVLTSSSTIRGAHVGAGRDKGGMSL